MPYYPPASSSGAPSTATYLTQVAESGLSAEQAMGLLATGLVKNATTTGVQSIATAGTDYLAPATTTIRSTDADLAMAVNTLYFWDISGLTADRTATLPGTAAVGDVCGICITTGDTAFEVLITATSGDTLNGVSGGSEWSRLFITNEVVLMRCVVANTTWIVTEDGRIPMKCLMEITGAPDGETANTYVAPTSAAVPGSWTSSYDIGDIQSTAASGFTVRRACKLLCCASAGAKDALTAAQAYSVRLSSGGTELASATAPSTNNSIVRVVLAKVLLLAANDAVTYQYRSQPGGVGVAASPTSFLSASEILP